MSVFRVVGHIKALDLHVELLLEVLRRSCGNGAEEGAIGEDRHVCGLFHVAVCAQYLVGSVGALNGQVLVIRLCFKVVFAVQVAVSVLGAGRQSVCTLFHQEGAAHLGVHKAVVRLDELL